MKFSSKVLAGLMSMLAVMVFSISSVFAQGLNWDTSSVTVTGSGVAPSNAVNAVQARLLARRAAVVDAYRQLAESIKGVNVDAETTVENMMVTSDVIRTKVSAMIQGAQVVSEREIPGGGYEVTMTVPLFGVSNSIAQAVIPQTTVVEPLPAPVPEVIPSMPAGSLQGGTIIYTTIDSGKKSPMEAIGGYTGVIIDCRGLGLKPVMSPVIKNDAGVSIYGHKNINPDKVIANGMADYAYDTSSNVARAGSNPLIIKAVSLDGGVLRGNPVVSTADANRILSENNVSHFLENTNVVFVR